MSYYDNNEYDDNDSFENEQGLDEQYFMDNWCFNHQDKLDTIWNNLREYTHNKIVPLLNECTFGDFTEFAFQSSGIEN